MCVCMYVCMYTYIHYLQQCLVLEYFILIKSNKFSMIRSYVFYDRITDFL